MRDLLPRNVIGRHLTRAGLPLLLYIWKPDAKWPNPLALDTAKRSKDK